MSRVIADVVWTQDGENLWSFVVDDERDSLTLYSLDPTHNDWRRIYSYSLHEPKMYAEFLDMILRRYHDHSKLTVNDVAIAIICVQNAFATVLTREDQNS